MSAIVADLCFLASAVILLAALWLVRRPATGRLPFILGTLGLCFAVAAMLAVARPSFGAFLITVLGLAMGGAAGALATARMSLAAMPRLLAALQAPIGLAAVAVAAAILQAPESIGIAATGAARTRAFAELSLAAVFGALTCAGGAVAFRRLGGGDWADALPFAGRWRLAAALAVLVALGIAAVAATESVALFWLLALSALALGALLATRVERTSLPILLPALCSGSGWAAAALGLTLENLVLIIVGASTGAAGAALVSAARRPGAREDRPSS